MQTEANGWEVAYTPANLRKLLKDNNLTINKLSELSNIPVSTINNWLVSNLENKNHRDMPLQTWRAIMVLLENRSDDF